VRLVDAGGTSVVLTRAARGSCYDLAAPIPATVPRKYTVQVRNNLLGSSWVPTSDGQKITVVKLEPAPSDKFDVKGKTGQDVVNALAAAGRVGGGIVELGAGTVYRMAAKDSLYVPDRVTLTMAGGGTSARGACCCGTPAAPRSQRRGRHELAHCRGLGQQLEIWRGNLSARIAECPPLIWGDGAFTIANISCTTLHSCIEARNK
jgi:hypothetical protein